MSTTKERQFMPKRNQYDSVFRSLFQKKERLLGLYNAVTGRNYTDTEALEVNTLDNAIYLGMRNDLSFIADFHVHLYEHQSTVNPNMALRDLIYVSQLYMKNMDKKKLYSTRALAIPAPNFIVFYNGTETQAEEYEYLLSDLYMVKQQIPNLELRVQVLNINPGYNDEIVNRSKDLQGYQYYVDKVRRYQKYMPIAEAVGRAIQECISEDVLKDFFMENKAEVLDMSIFEFDQELYDQVRREEAWEDGKEVGLAAGKAEALDLIDRLMSYLIRDNRHDDMVKMIGNKTYRDRLLMEYCL